MSEDTNQEILAELRKLTRTNQRAYYLLIIIGIVAATTIFFEKNSHQPDPWKDVNEAFYQQDLPRALSLAQAVVVRQPNYYYGHEYLGDIYLAMNDVTNAEKEFSRGYELLPNEDHEKKLEAVRKRIATEQGQSLQSK